MKLDDLHVKLFIDSSELDKVIEKVDILREKLESIGIVSDKIKNEIIDNLNTTYKKDGIR
jgi:hypothetical protein